MQGYVAWFGFGCCGLVEVFFYCLAADGHTFFSMDEESKKLFHMICLQVAQLNIEYIT